MLAALCYLVGMACVPYLAYLRSFLAPKKPKGHTPGILALVPRRHSLGCGCAISLAKRDASGGGEGCPMRRG